MEDRLIEFRRVFIFFLSHRIAWWYDYIPKASFRKRTGRKQRNFT